MKRYLILFFGVALILLAAPLSTAQAQKKGYGPNDMARVRVIHASPDAPPVTILVDDRPVFRFVRFGQVTFYAPLPAGSYGIKVVTADANQTVVIDTQVDVTAGTDYTIAAVGEAANIEPLIIVDDNERPATGKAKVRFVHLSPDAPAVDVAVRGGPVLFRNVPFKSVSDYQTVNPGFYKLEVRRTGTNDVVLKVPGFGLQSGTVSTVFALGLRNDKPWLRAKLQLDSRSRYGAGYRGHCCPHPPIYTKPPRCCKYHSYRPHPGYHYRPYYNYGDFSFDRGRYHLNRRYW